MFSNSEELKNDIYFKLMPWLSGIKVPTSVQPEWLQELENSVKRGVAAQLLMYVQERTLPVACVVGHADVWTARVTSPLRVFVSATNIGDVTQRVQILNLGQVASNVMEPLFKPNIYPEEATVVTPRTSDFTKWPTSNFVRSVMANVAPMRVADEFVLEQEARALTQILNPNTHLERRAAMAREVQESLRQDHEAKERADKDREALKETGFGRLVEID